jgi:hypothetical protein
MLLSKFFRASSFALAGIVAGCGLVQMRAASPDVENATAETSLHSGLFSRIGGWEASAGGGKIRAQGEGSAGAVEVSDRAERVQVKGLVLGFIGPVEDSSIRVGEAPLE